MLVQLKWVEGRDAWVDPQASGVSRSVVCYLEGIALGWQPEDVVVRVEQTPFDGALRLDKVEDHPTAITVGERLIKDSYPRMGSIIQDAGMSFPVWFKRDSSA